MGNTESLQLFEDRRIRTAWNEEEEKWYFSIVDIISVLTDSVDYQTARKYWNKLKQRLSEEGNESVTNCHQLKLTSPGDGKKYLTDIIYKAWSDMSAKEYKKFKGLTKENLRDNMTNKELVLNMLAELSAKEISESR